LNALSEGAGTIFSDPETAQPGYGRLAYDSDNNKGRDRLMHRDNSKINSSHLARKGVVYLRQSTTRQVRENNESTLRQYGLAGRLVDLGWPRERVQIIDQDLGTSGADSGRGGFQALVADVSNGLVGAVACIECSRLSRDSEDWIRLTKFCAYTDTLLIDADGVYDPNNFNDRLLLGLKGTMSEAELHFLQERMRGALLSKAKRGDLRVPLPLGYVYDGVQAIKDPDIEVQKSVELLFDLFRRQGAALRIVEHFKNESLKFPRKTGNGFGASDVEWLPLDYGTVLRILHNPFYAGVYYYGRRQTVWTPEGRKPQLMPLDEWHSFIKDHHAPYITFEEFESNERALAENRIDLKSKRERTPPREGPSLLQGLAYCGKCGCSMHVNYQHLAGKLVPIYRCDQEMRNYRKDLCQSIQGHAIDKKIAELLVDRLTPEAVEHAQCVHNELNSRQGETLAFFQMRIEKCEYEVRAARKRYMSVDPENRLVALQLESSWNKALKELDDANNEYAHQAALIEKSASGRDCRIIDDLPRSFREAFMSPDVSYRDKKRMVRYLIDDVTLLKAEGKILIQIRFKGGTAQCVEIDAPLPNYKMWITDPEVVKFIDSASDEHCADEIAVMLNQKGYKSGKGLVFQRSTVRALMRQYSILNKKQRFIARGYITTKQKAAIMGIPSGVLSNSVLVGEYKGEYVRVNSKRELLFPPE
jgi:DNA invertase Pin-like site-specific DNA recombinase